MSDNDQSASEDKSHEPTQQKLQKSRDQGDVPYSPEATTAATYLVLFIALLAMSGWVSSQTFKALAPFFYNAEAISTALFSVNRPAISGEIIFRASIGVAALIAVLICGVAISIIAQQSFTFSMSKLKLKWSRLSVVDNAKQKYGPNGIAEFVKKAVKLTAIMTIILFAFKDRFMSLPAMIGMPANKVMPMLQKEAVFFIGLIAAVSIVIGAVDMVWQQHQHRKKLRMTHEELKRENKESEGDPMMKSQRRQRAEAIAMNQMLADVPDADIVIVNPTHYATALKWNRNDGSAPICVAKGVDEVAARIREIASENGVPIKRDPPTARSIYALVEIGQEIKREHFAAVAAAIHYADQIRKKWRKK